MSEIDRHVTLFFDRDCAFCTASVRLGRRLGLRAEFQPLQSVDLASVGVDPVRAREEVALRRGDETVVYGHYAIAGALATGALPLRSLGHLLTWGPLNRPSAWGYRMVATHRRRLSRAPSAFKQVLVTLKEVTRRTTPKVKGK